MFRLSGGEEIMTLAFFVLIQYRSVTDRRTADGRTDGRTDIPPLAIPAVCISRYANALVKINKINRDTDQRPEYAVYNSADDCAIDATPLTRRQ